MSKRRSAIPGEIQSVPQKTIIYLVLLLGSVAMLVPFFWMVSTSFKTSNSIFAVPVEWWPQEPTGENYARLFGEFGFGGYIWNTIWVTAINMLGYLASCAMVAYAFATQRWKYKNILFMLVLATMMLPKEVIFYPRFILFKYLGLYGTMIPLWMPAFFGDAFQIFLMRQFFMGVPTELGEAAKIDGCSRFRIFWNIYLPLSKPVLATSAIYVFMFHWNDFFGPLIYITKEANRTAALGLMYLKSSQNPLIMMPIQMAGAVVIAIPCVLLYYFCQRYFVAGMTVSTGVEK